MARYKVAAESQGIARVDAQEAVRRTARQFKDSFTARRIATAAGVAERTARRALSEMEDEGLLVHTGKRRTQQGGYAKLYAWRGEQGSLDGLATPEDGEVEPVPVAEGDLAERLWRIMRLAKEWQVWDLVVAQGPTGAGRSDEIADYCHYLYQAGYLELVEVGETGMELSYRLARDTGHRAPRVEVAVQVADPNVGSSRWIEARREVCG